MRLDLIIRPRGRLDLLNIYDFIARDSPIGALTFIEEIEARCGSLADLPEQGRVRDDLHPGVRLLPFARRVVIADTVKPRTVEVERVFYGGQDYEVLLGE